MIGKVQDVVASAIVVGAAEKASADKAAVSSQKANAEVATAKASDMDAVKEQVQQGENARNAENQKQQNEEQKMDESSVSYMTEELNDLMRRIDADLEFQYHKEVNTMSVKMLDKKTGEVLKEVPPEEMIKHMIKAKDWLGAFLDKNA
ncbi:flagellar protein FlaG [Selenomonas ruminis]|uniref:Flagellar protein FlaG n=1 Tax=Selenomonas ruminis TaxID=2593411 RepID=A0A5D6VXV5_9FIRM|nr:flagellar protein FlaG [Selenomonas sp. mPRGC5]TYZ20317.1 flagellar protein FlaG [Selenomonas sp. mPRGC5]